MYSIQADDTHVTRRQAPGQSGAHRAEAHHDDIGSLPGHPTDHTDRGPWRTVLEGREGDMSLLWSYLRRYRSLVALALVWRPSTRSSRCSTR